MSKAEVSQESAPVKHRREQIENYWAGDLARKVYLVRRQRKAVLENCRRIAVVGASDDPDSASYIAIEKLLGMGLEIIPVFPGRESLLGLRCFERLRDVLGKLDVVLVYPNVGLDYAGLARDAVDKQVSTFWIEDGVAASREIEEILAQGKVHLVEYEDLVTEYLKHVPVPGLAAVPRREKKGARVKERMAKNVVTVRTQDSLNEAMHKMERGRFRHLPVIDDEGRLIGMLSDRDIRLIRPSLAFVNQEDAAAQLWSASVQQAAVFDPISVKLETSLREAAELMLRWHVGGLPVVEDHDKVIGMITYTDILREFVGHEEGH